MTIKIRHKFVSQKADSTDGSLIKPSNWNDDHTISLEPMTIIGNSSNEPGEADAIIVGHGLMFEGTRLDATRPGRLVFHFGNTPPPGTLKANGAEVSRSTYARLFAVIGTRFGVGNGTTTFNLPDARGYFIRGFDDGRGVDAGRGLGSFQDDENKSHNHGASTGEAGWHGHAANSNAAGNHNHTVEIMGNSDSDHANNVTRGANRTVRSGIYTTSTNGLHNHLIYVDGNGTHTHPVSIAASGGNESRPKNLAALICIEF